MADIAMPAAPSAITPAQQLNERFARIYTLYLARVTAYLTTQVRRHDLDLTEDLAAETFTRAWVSLHQVHGTDDTKLFRWLRTIASRVAIDHYRLARNTREVPADTGHWTFANRALAPATGGTLKPLGTDYPGDSDPDPDEALRRARAPRALVGAR